MIEELDTVAMTDDETGLFRAVSTNPADDAPRLVYADWLDERGDPRGEYLRVDLELLKGDRGPKYLRLMSRARVLRAELDRAWMVVVSRGPTEQTKRLDLTWHVAPPGQPGHKRIPGPSWDQVESAFRALAHVDEGRVCLSFPPGRPLTDFVVGVREGNEIRLAGTFSQKWHRLQTPLSRSDSQFDCVDVDIMIWVVKWAYYFREFAPSIQWTDQPVEGDASAFAIEERIAHMNELHAFVDAELDRIRGLCLEAGIDPDAAR